MRLFIPTAIAALIGVSSAHAADRADVIARAMPSVVTIIAKGKAPLPASQSPEAPDGFSPERDIHSVGSGFVIDSLGGYVVTADHVVEDTTDFNVTLSDGRNLPALLTGIDKRTGIAVLKITDTATPALSFCDTVPRIGDDALVIGNPYKLGLQAYSGMVSGVGVAIDENDAKRYIVLDIVMHKGLGGGPILSDEGCLTGMAWARYGVSSLAVNNLGLAIPAAKVQSITQELIRSGRIARGYIGVTLKGEDGIGQEVLAVTPEGPIDRAGIRSGDIILSFDGKPANNFSALSDYVADMPPGTSMTLKIRRGESEMTVTVVTEAAPPQLN